MRLRGEQVPSENRRKQQQQLTSLVRLHRRVQGLGKLTDDGLQVGTMSALILEKMQREKGHC